MKTMSAKRATVTTAFVALIGLIISGVIAYVHRNLAASSGYTSFCNVNESVNCDVVLSSSQAYFAGVPVAWWAMLTYLFVGVLAAIGSRATRATSRRRAATILFAVAASGLAYSLYLAGVSFFVLRAVCLLCSGLYLVNAVLVVTSWMLLRSVRAEGHSAMRGRDVWRARTRLITVGATATVAVFLALAWWGFNDGRVSSQNINDLAARHPDFYRWYNALPVTSLSPAGGHAKGGPANVVIEEFSDFQCGHCAKAYWSMKRALPRFGTDVQVVFHHFPLNAACNPSVEGSSHGDACLAAMASECAAAQGRFWEYHDLLFENQSALDRNSLIDYAQRLGFDRNQFIVCLESDNPRRAVARDVKEGDRLGVTSTPTLFFNGRTVPGALDSDKLEHAIRFELATRQNDR